MAQALHLGDDRPVDLLVGVPHGDGEDAAEEVQIALALQVPHPTALAVGDHHRLRMQALDLRKQMLSVLPEHRRRAGGRRKLQPPSPAKARFTRRIRALHDHLLVAIEQY